MSAESRLAHALADERKTEEEAAKEPDREKMTQNLKSALAGFVRKSKKREVTAPPPVVESP